MSWHVRVQYWTRRDRARWLDFGPMPYARAVAEGRRHVASGRNARLVDPDGHEGPLITLPPAPSPATTRKSGGELQLPLFPME